ncbi:MAG TPA: DUF3352 domain-containing protein [Candidatus Limnocylindria bacterium]|nr:DUF3352 domain-containing protein [Candidatus Limnocylindria bacterium]
MTVTSNSDAAPWDGGSRDPFSPQPPAQPPLEPVRLRTGGPLRWLVAILATVLVLGVVGVVFVLANPPATAGGVSPLAKFAPADSVLYIEARLDLPGDQRDNVIELMSNFPGFADPASFDQKIGELLDEVFESSPSGVDWQTDIEPWFGGQLVVFMDSFESGQGTPQSGTVVLSVKDAAAVERFLDEQMSSADYEPGEHREVTIWTGRLGTERASLATTADALLVSYRIEDMHSAIDVQAGEADGLADDERFSASMAKLATDRLLALYVDGEAVTESLGSVPMGGVLDEQLAQAPGTIVGQLRAAEDHLLLEMRMQPRAGQSFPDLPQSRTSTLASSFPAGVLGYGELRDLGQGLRTYVTQVLEFVGASPGMGGGSLPDLEQFLGTPPEDFLDFVGDTAVAVSADGDGYGGGLVAVVTDEDVARQRLDRLVTSLRTMLAFAGPNVPLTIEEETHNGVPATVFRLRAEAGMDLPFSSFSYAIANGRLLAGVDGFVAAALTRGEGQSLASSAGYSRALAAAGESNAGLFYLNMGELRRIIETEMSADDRAEAAEFWPYFERFSQVIGTVTTDGREMVSRFLLFVE